MNMKQFFETGRSSYEGQGMKTGYKKLWTCFVILFGLFLITFIFMAQSPLNILLLNGNSGIDSSVFRTIAMQMKKGLMPYRDSFDHKGPLLYIYNYWGFLIRKHRGIWIIEFLSAFTTFCLMYKIARLKCGRSQAFLIVIICITPLYAYFEGGNLTEEYALPFIASSLYIFTDYFVNRRISRIRLAICGLGFGAVCLLRINMVAVWIVFCCGVLMQSILSKCFKELPRFLLWFLVGAGGIVIPICCWLLMNNAFSDFIKDYFVFNAMYTQDAAGATALNRYNSFSKFMNNIYVLTAIVIIVYSCKKNELFHWVYLGYEIVGLLLICMSGQSFAHYGMVLVPMLVYPFSLLLSGESVKERTWLLAFVLYLAVAQVIPTWIGGIDKTAEYLLAENKTRERTDAVGQICTYIKKNSDKDDRIVVWGNWNIIYVQSERLPASKYSYQAPIGSIDERIIIDFFEEINETKPRMIVVPNGRKLGSMEGFLEGNGYECVYEIDGATVYIQSA